jgi:hypothetical protein
MARYIMRGIGIMKQQRDGAYNNENSENRELLPLLDDD